MANELNEKKLLLVGGVMGVGKTTICRIMHRHIKNSAYLDVDDVWNINPWEVSDRTKDLGNLSVCGY